MKSIKAVSKEQEQEQGQEEDDDVTQLCLSREEEESSSSSSSSSSSGSDNDVEAASNPKQKLVAINVLNVVDKEQPSNHHQVVNKNKDNSNIDDSSLFCRRRRRRRRNAPPQQQHGRFLLRLGALILLIVGVLLIALITTMATRGSNNGNSNSNNALDAKGDVPSNDDRDRTNPPITATPTASPVPSSSLPICIQVSYQLEHLQWTAQQVRDEDGTTLRTGLTIAAQRITAQFAASYTQPQRRPSVLATNSDLYPALVTNIVDISTFCPNPNCLLVSQNFCVLYEPAQDGDNPQPIEAAFRQVVRNAISSGALLQQVPAQHLP